ncbi:MAG: FIST signal transduction protein [Pseudobdellovibrionaceae bacterium]
MKVQQKRISKKEFSVSDFKNLTEINPHLVTVFGAVKYFEDHNLGKKLKDIFPNAHVIGCSTAGEISEDGVFDENLIITSVHFKKPNFKSFYSKFSNLEDSENAGAKLAEGVLSNDLNGIFILGQGININGSALIAGIRSKVAPNVVITGGLAGDGGVFKKTYVLSNEIVSSDIIAGVGLYGSDVTLGFGSMGGWEPFGPPRRVTKASGNILFELDGQPALEIYKKYLGAHAKDLPSSGLLFPFAILKNETDESGLIRTILGIDENNGSLTLAGDIPQNGYLRLMHSKTSGLVNGAEKAAQKAWGMAKPEGDEFSILVSCVGRKLVMGQDVDDEVDAVKTVLKNSLVTGFYSYGEICPHTFVDDCKLHNQTMTITRFKESA